jgi:hypothetical protein
MIRERALKVALVMVGILFCATAYPLIAFIRDEPALAMMLVLYVTLGVFLLLAVRDPGAHRSLIAFAAWSSVAHSGLMAVQAHRHFIQRSEWIGVAVFAVIGVVLIGLRPKMAKFVSQG